MDVIAPTKTPGWYLVKSIKIDAVGCAGQALTVSRLKAVKGKNSFRSIELLIVIVVVGTVGAISVPGWLRARVAGNEASIIALLHAINSAQSRYAASCANGYYAPTLALLATPPAAGGDHGFLSQDVQNDPSMKRSYNITLTAGLAAPGVPAPCNGTVPGTVVTTYFVAAVPISDEESVFGTNQSGRIYQSNGTMAVTYSGVPFGANEIQ